MNCLKILNLVCCLACSITLMYAQPTRTATFANSNATANSLVIKAGGANYHFNKLALKTGKNVKRLDKNISIEIVKSKKGKIVSIKTKKGNAQGWSSDVLANPGGGSQEFECNPHVCVCSGLFDCFDMVISVCDSDSKPECTDDDGGVHCACVR